mmetsp:Transcript_10301/g.26143  ORF Transcript_10301/g.26143 Transcript_10301/m.26143 type:complete len:102 (+) Transcript_10301:1-306(+)
MDVAEHFRLLLTNSIGDPKQKLASKNQATNTIMDEYEYVMHGKIFRIQEGQENTSRSLQQEVYISFGGLLMLLVGDAKPLEHFKVDTDVYLLIKKEVKLQT